MKRLHTYSILVKETGPKSSEVQILAKVQETCEKTTVFAMVVQVVTIVPISMPFMEIPANVECNKLATVRWATDKLEEFDRFLTFTRNNLIAAGAL